MTDLLVLPQARPLRGIVRVPGDKSISHRAVILGALAEGRSRIQGWLPAGDTLATLEAVRQMGIVIREEQESLFAWNLEIEGQGLRGLKPSDGPLDCRNAGTCLRLLAGVMAGQDFPSILDGSDQLRRRPMGRIVQPLQQMGAQIRGAENRAPLAIAPADLLGIEYKMPVASAQVKSALLLAGLYATGDTRVYQPGPSRDHTERLLQAMGVALSVEEGWITLHHSPQRLRLAALDLVVPGDFSSAAFPLVAAALVPGSQVTLQGVGINETRTGLLDLLKAMGARIEISGQQETGGEPAADLLVQAAELRAVDAAGDVVVRAIDEFPVWAVAAAGARGTSRLRDAAELRVKEVDRIAVLAGELRRLGVPVSEQADGLTVEGAASITGGEVDSHGDHRLGMALAVAGLLADKTTVIQHADCIADSFPGFVETMHSLGAGMEWLS